VATKSRFKKKEIEVKSVDLKNNLTLIKKEDSGHLNWFNNLKTSEEATVQDAVKLHCYHKINELYQDNTLNLYHLLKGVLDIASLGVDSLGGSLWIVEEKGDITCKVANGDKAQNIEGTVIKSGEGIVGWCVENKKSTLVFDTSKDTRFMKSKNNLVKTLISVPLLYNNEVLGVVQVVNKKDSSEHFSEHDKSFLEDLATNVAMHLKSQRTFKTQDKLLKKMETFSKLHDVFSSTIDLDELLRMVLKKAINLVHAEVGSLWLVEDNGEGIECCYAHGATKEKVEGLKLKKGVGIIGDVVESRQPKIIEDCTKDDSFSNLVDKKTNFETRSMITSPLNVKGECIGAIQIINKRGNSQYFHQEDLDLLVLFASSSAMYIKNARLFNSEKKAKDLTTLIDIGKEITSTLDLDSVLMTLVNLSSNVIPFDLASVSTLKIGRDDAVKVRAISGEKEVDLTINKNNEINEVHNYILNSEKEEFSISKGKEEEKNKITEYMEEYDINYFWAKVLKDDQGNVGIMHLESDDINLLSGHKYELLSILVSQTTVSLRNVELYSTIPSGQFLKNIKTSFYTKLIKFKSWERKTYYQIISATVVSLFLLLFVKIPYNVSANVQLVPVNKLYFSKLNAVVSSINVEEGSNIKKGDILLTLDSSQDEIDLKNKESQRIKTKIEMMKLKNSNKIADYKIKENELLSYEYEITLLKDKIKDAVVTAKEAGIVISENLDELVGMPVNYGQELVKIASKDNIIAQFEVPQDEILNVQVDHEVKFKVYGHPSMSLDDINLISVGGEAKQVLESDPTKYYIAKTMIDLNSVKKKHEVQLRPGMTGRGKIYSNWKPVGEVLFSGIFNFFAMEVFF